MSLSEDLENRIHQILDNGISFISESPPNDEILVRSENFKVQEQNRDPLNQIKEAQKQLERISLSIRKPRPVNLQRELARLKQDLVNEKKRSAQIRNQNIVLLRKLKFKENLETDLQDLFKDYEYLQKSFERSEKIRIQQKQLIESLKSQFIHK